MAISDRHRLVYHQEPGDSSDDPPLDYAVEKPWACPPMPSRAFWRPGSLGLTQPKPDLAVAFRRDDIFPSGTFSPVVPGYPLVFAHTKLLELEGDMYTRDNVVEAMEKIVVGYGLRELRAYLKAAAAAFVAKCCEFERDNGGEQLERPPGYYSHWSVPALVASHRHIDGLSQLDIRPARDGPSPSGRARHVALTADTGVSTSTPKHKTSRA